MNNFWKWTGHIWAFCSVGFAGIAVLIGGLGLEHEGLAQFSFVAAMMCVIMAAMCWRQSL